MPNPTSVYRRVSQVLPTLREDRVLCDDLYTFGVLKKWTIALFARRWGCSEATATRALRRLHDLGLVACLQGRGRAVTGAHHGGRTPDVYFLTPLGARAISALTARPSRVREPRVARGAPQHSPNGLWKYHRASAQSWGQIAHDLACVEFALHQGAFAPDSGWRARRSFAFADPQTGTTRHLVPDFALAYVHEVFAPGISAISPQPVQTACFVEIEGTDEIAHIQAKHVRYWALGDAHGADPLLLVVFTFGPDQARLRRAVLRRHLAAYGATGTRRYRFAYLDLATLLATPAGEPPWARAVFASHGDARREAWLGR